MFSVQSPNQISVKCQFRHLASLRIAARGAGPEGHDIAAAVGDRGEVRRQRDGRPRPRRQGRAGQTHQGDPPPVLQVRVRVPQGARQGSDALNLAIGLINFSCPLADNV